MNEELNYMEKLAKGIITDEEIEKMVDMCIPIEKDSVLNIIGYAELLKENQVLQKENAELKEKINTYENPKDLTLFYMWLDEKTKDKIKELEKENQMLKLTVEKLTKMPCQYDIRMN